jgi:GT2 family glycosyltransferase
MLRFGRKRAKPSVITLADQARDQGQWERAAAYYQVALRRNSQNPPIWVQYGHVLKEAGNVAAAERTYRRAIACDPRLADCHLQLGRVLKIQGKNEEAQASYLRAIALEPSLPEPLHELRTIGWQRPQIAELERLFNAGPSNAIKAEDNRLQPPQVDTAEQLEGVDPSFGLARAILETTFLRKRLDQARSWYRNLGRKVVILIPSYRDSKVLSTCVHGLRRTTRESMVHIVIVDDFSQDDEHISFLKRLALEFNNMKLIFGEKNVGFAGNVNRGLQCCHDHDVVLMNSDVEPLEGWLEILQYSVYANDAAIGAPRLLYPSREIQFGGGMRNFGAPSWFDHFYRAQPAEFAPALPDVYMLYATGAVMYLRLEALHELGKFDPEFPMAFEDVDLCLRGWKRGLRTIYVGAACAIHHESITRGRDLDDREIKSQDYFWHKHRGFFLRSVRNKVTGQPHVIFVCQDVGVGGGHRVIYTHANYLARNGFTVELWNLAGSPDWFTIDQNIKIKVFGSYYELTQALNREDAIKIATWWETAEPVWLGSVLTGIPVYFVQDIESSYYKGLDDAMAARVLSWYRPEFNYVTTTRWIKRELESILRLNAVHVGLGYQSDQFRRLDGIVRGNRTVLVAVRGERLKNFAYSSRILAKLREAKIDVIAFGSEGPALLQDLPDVEFYARPTDDELCQLYNRARFFLQTSMHEGFSLPPVEAMACGCVPILTEASGNTEYIEDQKNCIVIPSENVVAAVDQILTAFDGDPRTIDRLVQRGIETTRRYNWEGSHQRMHSCLNSIVTRPEYGLQIREQDLT